MPTLEQARGRYLRTPVLQPRSEGGATLYAVAWEPAGERVMAFDVDERGHVRAESAVGAVREAIRHFEPGVPGRPADAPDVEHRDVSEGWRARVDHYQGESIVVVHTPEGPEVVVWRAPGLAAAPALCAVDDGVWVAFHHDVREDTGEPDVAKWIALRFVARDGTVHEPTEPMRERDRDAEGVEQSFEFPALAVGEDGAVAIFGRGSHNFWRQDVNATGFTPRYPLSDGEWGCRGRRVAVTRQADGSLLTARRERAGIDIERQAAPRGGRPTLREATALTRATAPLAASAAASTGAAAEPASGSGRVTLFGDIHQHSAHSDAVGTADETYLRARWRYGDDFCALTDHESFLGKRIGPGEWSYLQAVAERHHEPERFVTLIAYEWTGRRYPGPGHKVVYFSRPGMPIISRDDVPEGKDLVQRLKRMGGFAVPHHVGWTGADEPGHDPDGQPVWEVCSCHGCYEHPAHPLGQRGEHEDQLVGEMLRKGLRFGLIACSDSHGLVRHHGIARKRDPFRTGLTAVQAGAHTREGVIEALRERRCYATSGAKIGLDMHGGDVPMGGVLQAPGEVPVRVQAVGTAPLARVEIVGPEGPLAQCEPAGFSDTLHAQVGGPWFYARVTQQDGEMAWSSPIFVDPR